MFYFNGRPLPGLSISGLHTFDSFEMIPKSRLLINPPEVKTKYVDLPGTNGGLDYTELLTGHPNFGYRKGSWEFFLIPGESWATVYNRLCDYLHGKTHSIVMDDEPNNAYHGRLSVSKWQSSAHNSTITIDYTLDPEPEVIGDPEDYEGEILLAGAERLLKRGSNYGKVIQLDENGNAEIANKQRPPVISLYKLITANGDYYASDEPTYIDGYNHIVVDVPDPPDGDDISY